MPRSPSSVASSTYGQAADALPAAALDVGVGAALEPDTLEAGDVDVDAGAAVEAVEPQPLKARAANNTHATRGPQNAPAEGTVASRSQGCSAVNETTG